ncbi:GNAT family N-acetyltransferase [Usitatibacter palustris]|uniref:N-acetyltransferase domain-containing protein n=1 Tax=Usitatibacter palustris TaxID=2732487 RepID=A0A6M4H4Z1_9PROT|nr:GNAT family N-acetyltransferase [Usitatibacter palustris]QJR13763.1 hypothetical protein DSM104440_00553 [Usitatibacter palustris]
MSKLAFLSAGAAQGLVAAHAKTVGVDVGGTFGPVGGIRDRFLAGEPCDVLILTHTQICELIATGKVPRDACSDLGLVRTSVVVHADADIPDVSTPAALRTAILAASAIHFPDPVKATAGAHVVKVLESLGVRRDVESRLRMHPGGMPSMVALAADRVDAIGITQATEILASRGVRLAGHLPRPHHLATVYTAVVGPHPLARAEAERFVASITAQAEAGRRLTAGFEGPSIRRATRADEAAIRELVFTILDEYAIKPEPKGTDADLFDLEANYFARGGTFDVAVDTAGNIVGTCGSYPMDGNACELRKMYVRSDQRGRGLGKRLLERALAFARARGCARVVLETASVLKEATLMYEKAGFIRQAYPPHVRRCDRVYAYQLA